MSEYTPTRSKTPYEWAEHFGAKAINAMLANESPDLVGRYARLAASFATIALEKDAQAIRNAAHIAEVNRAFGALDRPQTWFSLQEVQDQRLTEYMRDAHLGAVES